MEATEIEDRSLGALLHQQATHGLRNAGGFLGALDLDGPPLGDLVPAVADLVHGQRLDARPDAAPRRYGGREANLVPAVVDAHLEAGRLHQPGTEAVDRREGQVAVGDRRAKRALRP